MARKRSAKGNNSTIDELVGGFPPEIVQAVSQLRQLIMDTVPTAQERVRSGWKSINYLHPEVGYFCGLFPTEDQIDISFEFGVLLPDPEGLFVRFGKQVGFMLVRDTSEIRQVAFKRLLRAAVSLPAERDARLALVRSGARPMSSSGEGG